MNNYIDGCVRKKLGYVIGCVSEKKRIFDITGKFNIKLD